MCVFWVIENGIQLRFIKIIEINQKDANFASITSSRQKKSSLHFQLPKKDLRNSIGILNLNLGFS